MLVISNNINTRVPKVARMLAVAKSAEKYVATELQDLARDCIKSGADMLEINLQQHFDRPDVMEFAVREVQKATDCQLCLSSNNLEALETGLRLCRKMPLVNFVTIDNQKLQGVLPLVARYGAQVLLLITDPASPGDAEGMMKKASILVGAANESGIPNDDIFVDPGLIHITHDQGQRHFPQVVEFLRSLPEVFNPPVKSTCWLANSSAGAPTRLRPVIETTVLATLTALGLSSVFIDVLRPANMRMVRLLRILNNELIYSDSELEL